MSDTGTDDRSLAEARPGITTLGVALDQRATISTAVGIVMERYTLDEGTAIRRLTRSSAANNISVHDLAKQLVSDGWAADL